MSAAAIALGESLEATSTFHVCIFPPYVASVTVVGQNEPRSARLTSAPPGGKVVESVSATVRSRASPAVTAERKTDTEKPTTECPLVGRDAPKEKPPSCSSCVGEPPVEAARAASHGPCAEVGEFHGKSVGGAGVVLREFDVVGRPVALSAGGCASVRWNNNRKCKRNEIFKIALFFCPASSCCQRVIV